MATTGGNLAMLLADMEGAARSLESAARQVRGIAARIKEHEGSVGAGDIERETLRVLQLCEGPQLGTLTSRAFELVAALGTDGTV